MDRAGGSQRRAQPHPHAQMRKRLRQAHEQAVAHRLRDQSLALAGILLPLLSLSLLQAFAVTEAVRVQYDQALVELLLWLKSQGYHGSRRWPGSMWRWSATSTV